MSICANCQRQADKSKDAFTQKERIQLLSAEAVMLRHLMANPNARPEDKEVGNSIVTKLLLSLPPELQQAYTPMLFEQVGVVITLKDCPHGVIGILG